MAASIPTVPALVTPGDLADELQSFVRHLRAQNVSPNTVYAYVGAVVSLGYFLRDNDYPTDVRAIERCHIELWQEYHPPDRTTPWQIGSADRCGTAANVGAKIELEAQRRRDAYAEETSRRREVPYNCSAAIERLEAAMYVLFRNGRQLGRQRPGAGPLFFDAALAASRLGPTGGNDLTTGPLQGSEGSTASESPSP